MKKQEMHPEKDQYRSSDKNQSQDRSTKTKPQAEERVGKKAPREQEEDMDMDYADLDSQGSQKESSRKQANESKKVK